MKGYLIDPVSQTIEPVEHSGDWRDIAPALDCERFDIVRIDDANDVHVDDEGLINGNPHGWFELRGYPQPLRGRGLVLGCDGEGATVAASISIDDLREMVTFPTNAELRLRYSKEV